MDENLKKSLLFLSWSLLDAKPMVKLCEGGQLTSSHWLWSYRDQKMEHNIKSRKIYP